jgi:hypothetical protein
VSSKSKQYQNSTADPKHIIILYKNKQWRPPSKKKKRGKNPGTGRHIRNQSKIMFQNNVVLILPRRLHFTWPTRQSYGAQGRSAVQATKKPAAKQGRSSAVEQSRWPAKPVYTLTAHQASAAESNARYVYIEDIFIWCP